MFFLACFNYNTNLSFSQTELVIASEAKQSHSGIATVRLGEPRDDTVILFPANQSTHSRLQPETTEAD